MEKRHSRESVWNMTIPPSISGAILLCCAVGSLYTIYRRDFLLCALFVAIGCTFAMLLRNVHALELAHSQLRRAMARERSKLKEVSESARKDPLTQLYNKTETEEMIADYLCAYEGPSVFMIIDIDNFKGINDTLGHLYGDAVLSELALRLKTIFRDTDVVGRIGGDEFIVFMTNISDMEVIKGKIEKILCTFNRSFAEKDVSYKISASVGVAFHPKDGATFSLLMEKADKALYFAKKHGKNRYAIYTNAIETGEDVPAEIQLDDVRQEAAERLQKNFRENIADYMLKIFYEYNDVERSVAVLLDFVGRTYGIGRIEVVTFSEDDKWFYCRHEWCMDGVQSVSSGIATPTDEWEGIRVQLDRDNILYCEDVQEHLPNCLVKDSIKERGAKSVIICYILDGDKRQAAVSFEYFAKVHPVSAEERDALLTISRTICLFIIRGK